MKFHWSSSQSAALILLFGTLSACGGAFNNPSLGSSRTLTYEKASYTVVRGGILLTQPPVLGGNKLDQVATYTVSPALPTGLTLHPSNGQILGTPTVTSPTTTYTIQAVLPGSTIETQLEITVNDSPPLNLRYLLNSPTYSVGNPISDNVPLQEGGLATLYFSTPALPTGLSIDTTSGVISGTPTVIDLGGAQDYVVTATNSGGSSTATLHILVSDAPPTNLHYPSGDFPGVYIVGSAIAGSTPLHSGGTVVSYAITPTLPSGLAFDTTTGAITGTPTAVSAAATYTITGHGANPSDIVTTAVTITVNAAPPANLHYVTDPATYTRGVAISTPDIFNGTATGGAVSGCTITPSLPAGMTLSTTCAIGGTPAVLATSASYLVLASNSGGSTTTTVNITVIDAAPSALVYTTSPAVYTKGLATANNFPTFGGGTPVSYSVSPTLPSGLSLNTTTGVISGTPSAITATATYVITATNTGGSTTGNLSITVNDAAPGSLSYSSPSAVYTKGSAITTNTATVTGGGTVTGFTVVPALPAGLALNSTTGAISGTPTAIATSAIYIVSAANSGGSASANLTITVNDVAPSSLAYSTNPAIYTKGAAITNDTPTSSGGAVTAYSITPSLPAGLSFSTTTGVISGTPTALSAASNYVVTGSNTGGSTTVNLTVTVNDVAPSGLTYSTNPAVYTRAQAITANTPALSGGGTVTGFAITPALPSGLSMDPTSGIITGTPTAISVATPYSITASNTGGSTSVTLNLTVNDLAPTGLAYSVNPATYTAGSTITNNIPSISGGGAIVTYSSAPSLPAGLSLDPSTGIISGTPSAPVATATYTVTGTNSGGPTTASLSILVNNAPPNTLTYSQQTTTYTKGVAITNNTPTNGGGPIVTYTIAPTLPAGLALSASTGVISGTPTAITSTATYTVTGTNAAGSTSTPISITVNDAIPVLTYTLNPATYTKSVAIASNSPTNTGGAVVTWSISSLPAGLSFNTSTGAITGTPTAITGTAVYVVSATNTGGTATVNVTITVNDAAPVTLAYSTNPAIYIRTNAVTANNATVTGGGPITGFTVSPTLPAGLSMNAANGQITGTPTAITATATYTVSANNTGGSATASLVLTVNDLAPTALSYTTAAPTYTKGTAIASNNPSNTGGAITSYSVSPALPAGLTLDTTTGKITGTPTVVAASNTYTVTGLNVTGSTTKVLTIIVKDVAPSALVYSTPGPVTYTKGTAITSNTPSNGGGTVVSYAIAPALPAGLSLSTTTGVISGTATALATAASYTVTATNTGGSTTKAINITVIDAAPTSLTYSSNSPSYQTYIAITSNTPSNSGGTVVSYAVAPALPTGLAMSTTTGVITGTPTVVTGTATYTVTATNTGGSTTQALSITITASPANLGWVVGASSPNPPNPANYGSVNANTTFTYTLKNTGGTTSSAISTSISGTDASMWSFGVDGCNGSTLATNATCTVQATFLAAQVGATSGTKNATLQATATSGGTTTNAMTGSLAYTWVAGSFQTASPSYNSTTAPSGGCTTQGLTQKIKIADAPSGTQTQLAYSAAGNGFCGGGTPFYFQLQGFIRECGTTTPSWPAATNGSTCSDFSTPSTIWADYNTGAQPLVDGGCDTSFKYIVTVYTCK